MILIDSMFQLSSKMSGDCVKKFSNRKILKDKRPKPRTVDSGNNSDDSFEQCNKRIKILDFSSNVTNESEPRAASIFNDEYLEWKSECKGEISSHEGENEEDDEWIGGGGESDIFSDGGENEEDSESFNYILGESENSSFWGTLEEFGDSVLTDLYENKTNDTSSSTYWESANETGRSEEIYSVSPESGTVASTHGKSVSTPCEKYVPYCKAAQPEECPICLQRFTTQEIGSPETCNHSFCYGCLEEWAKYINMCPLDQQMFTSILVRRCPEGEVIRRIEPPSPQKFPIYCEACGDGIEDDSMIACWECILFYHSDCLDFHLDGNVLHERFCLNCDQHTIFNPNEELKCVVCGTRDGEDFKVFCNTCRLYFHLQCLVPSMDETVPRDEWFCPKCLQQSTLVTITEILNSLSSP